MASPTSLLDLPPELLSILFSHLATETFVHLTLTCKRLFELARNSRDALSDHIDRLPGIKLGLDAKTMSTSDLFLLVRQRASQNLVGAAILADCRTTNLRFAELNPSASCLTAFSDYFNGSLAMQNSLTVRHCTINCHILQEKITSPYGDGRAKVIQVVHTKNSVSTLYAWKPDKSDHIISCPSTPPLGNAGYSTSYRAAAAALGSNNNYDGTQYHLFHHNAYSTERPIFFHISFPYKHWREKSNGFPDIGEDFEPIHLAVHQRRMCVVIWRAGSKSKVLPQRPSPTVVVLYRADDLPKGYAGYYTATILLPLRKPPPTYETVSEGFHTDHADWTENIRFFSGFQLRAAAFCEGGKYLKLYQPGSVVPYGIIPTLSISNGTMRAPGLSTLSSFNKTALGGHQFRLDTIFHSSHRYHVTRNADTNASSTYCTLGCLGLAWLTKDDPGKKQGRWQEQDTLFIMQYGETTLDGSECDHEEVQNGDTCVADRGYNTRVVARLRGLDGHWPLTSLAGLDTVCISQKGTRIAIACWDKILVWALDPSVLVEAWVANDDESEAGSENGDGSDDVQSEVSNTASTGQHDTTAASAVSVPVMGTVGTLSIQSEIPTISKRAMVKATRYYELTDDPDFGEIVELWPEVLQLPEGMVARKMMWPVPESKTFADVYEENSEDSLRASDSEEDSDDDTDESQQANEDDEEMDDGASSIGSNRRSRRPRTLVGDGNLLVNDEQLRLENMLQEYIENSRKAEAGEEVEPAPRNENEDVMDVDDDSPANALPGTSGEDHLPSVDANKIQQPSNTATADKGKAPEELPSPDEVQAEDELMGGLTNTKAEAEGGEAANKPWPRRKRRGEDRLVVMTDRGLVAWDLGPRAKGRRVFVDVIVNDDEN